MPAWIFGLLHRELGNTGLKVSEIGLGCEGFLENQYQNIGLLLDTAQEYGVNYIDLYTPDPLVALQAVRSGHIEVLMFSINPCYDLLPANEDVNALWDEKNYREHVLWIS